MKLREFKGTVAALAVISATLVLPGISSAASIKGDGFTASSNILGDAPAGVLSFVINAENNSGTMAVSRMDSNPESQQISGLNLISSSISTVKCVNVSANIGYFSVEQTFSTPDSRVSALSNEQTKRLEAGGNYITVGKFIDNENSSDKRSLFSSSATVPAVTILSVGEYGSVAKNLLGKNATNACLLGDDMLRANADFIQLDKVGNNKNCCYDGKPDCTITLSQDGRSSTNMLKNKSVPLCDLQWVNASTGEPIPGAVFANNDQALNPNSIPAAALYDDLANITRTFQAGDIKVSP